MRSEGISLQIKGNPDGSWTGVYTTYADGKVRAYCVEREVILGLTLADVLDRIEEDVNAYY